MEQPDFQWLAECYKQQVTTLPTDVSGRLQVRDTADRGRGLFLSAAAEAGEVLFVCEAFVLGPEAELQERTLKKLREASEDDFQRFMSLQEHPGSNGVKPAATVLNLQSWGSSRASRPCQRAVDSEKVKNVLRLNTLARDSLNEHGFAEEATLCGVWPLCCLINHSCLPNVQEQFLGDLLILRAAKPIAAGEELLMSYVSTFQPRHIRRQHLSATFQFSCTCPRCTLEAAIPEKTAAGLLEGFDAIIADARPGKLPEFTSKLGKLVKQCEEVSRAHAVDGKESLLTASFLPIFMGLAMARKRLKCQTSCDAYARCVTLMATVCFGSLYHLHWSFMSALEVYQAKDDLSACREAWQLCQRFADPKVCGSFAKKMAWPKELIDKVEESNKVTVGSEPVLFPGAAVLGSGWTYSIQEEETLIVLSITLPEGLNPQDLDVDVSAAEVSVTAVTLPELKIQLPSLVDADAAMPAKFKRTTRQLILRLPSRS
eukprot:symbB.v1.2.036828.t1/scaffold5292.1/size28769/1